MTLSNPHTAANARFRAATVRERVPCSAATAGHRAATVRERVPQSFRVNPMVSKAEELVAQTAAR